MKFLHRIKKQNKKLMLSLLCRLYLKTREDLLELLQKTPYSDELDTHALTMVEGILAVHELRVRDIMIPKTKLITLNQHDPLETILPVVIQSTHSRFPVIQDNQDNVAGILLAKDLLAYNQQSSEAFQLHDILRPAMIIPESKRLDVLLQEFRTNRNHMAIVVDEYGRISGLVTIEDVLEQIVGDIEDESDVPADRMIKAHSADLFSVKAITSVQQFNDFFNANFEEPEIDTIGGLVARRFDRLPKRNESIQIEGFLFKVLRADERRIHLLQVQPLEPSHQ